ncbi:MAG: LptF/LptG family permease [Chlamydiia bacterium]
MTPYKYIFRQLARNFFGSYFLFCLLFIINFMAMHLEMAEKNRFHLVELLEHVVRITLAHSYILAPLALLMSSCLTYTVLQVRLEITAFLTQGISRYQLLKPLLHLSLFLVLLEGFFYQKYDESNEQHIEKGAVIGSNKTQNHPVQTLDLEENERVLFSTTHCKEAYLYTKDKKVFYTSVFQLKNPVFIAEKQLHELELIPLSEPKLFPLHPLPTFHKDPSKPLQILLVFLIPLLIQQATFQFKRHTRPLMILAKTSILYLGSHILVKSLCHILSKII